MIRKLIYIFILLYIPLDSIYSQSISIASWRIGLYGAYGMNNHIADFKKLPDCPNCSPGFEAGRGFSPTFGLLFEDKLNELMRWSLKAEYYNYSGILERKEQTFVIPNGTTVEGEFTHTLESGLSSIGLLPEIKYNIFGKLYLNAGIHFGYVMQKSYKQKEEITKPVNSGSFLDSLGNDTHKAIRNDLSGNISSASSINISPMLSISYELPLSSDNSYIAEPFASMNYNLMNVVSSGTVKEWNVLSLRLGVAVKYSPVKRTRKIIEEIPEEIQKFENINIIDTIKVFTQTNKKDTVVLGVEQSEYRQEIRANIKFNINTYKRTDTLYSYKKLSNLSCSLVLVGLDSTGKEIPNPTIKIEEFVGNKLQPLLNYVFFDEKSSIIPGRYSFLTYPQTNDFSENGLFNDSTLGIYYHLLNIVGFRMRNNPKAILTITGCNDGFSSEKNDIWLSEKRAENVRQYFLDVWKIDGKRLILDKRNLPQQPSTPINQPEKIEENRRVELTSNIYEILKPVFISDTIRKATPPVLRFKPNTVSEAGINSWEIHTRQFDNDLRTFAEKGDVHNIDWDIVKDPVTSPKYSKPLIYRLKVTDNDGIRDSTLERPLGIQLISVSQKRSNRIGDVEIDSYSLILFDFNSAEIGKANKAIIDFIRPRIKRESSITITGYTDRTGDDEHNKKLSGQRAFSAKQSLGRTDAQSLGRGEEVLLFNNDIPEGRFYCRTVNIVVQTKVK